MRTKEKLNGIWLPRPTDQRYNLSLYFTDYFPGTDRWRLTLKAAFADGLLSDHLIQVVKDTHFAHQPISEWI